jgi:dienelactone hydrolase
MFQYFPENYAWSMAVLHALQMGGVISEIDDVCRELKEASKKDDDRAQEAWCESWRTIGQRVETIAGVDEKAGRTLSAGRKFLRAAVYYLEADRMLPIHDPRKIESYKHGLALFKKGAQLSKEPVEWVEIPFRGKSMPALFSTPPGNVRRPCMVHFDGFDMLKEFLYIMNAETFRRRGISVLVVDHPGVGEALRLRGMIGGPDTETPAAACVDYLEKRREVDSQRIGIIAQSLGGYYGPRAAAFEKRFKCCIAHGAMWDFGEGIRKRLQGKGGEKSVGKWEDQLMMVFGKNTLDEAVKVAQQLTLEGIADKITCPLLVIHGENDRQVPLAHARKTIDAAVNSPKKELKIFTPAEGGAEHVQIDNRTLGVDYAADWAAEVLGGDPKGI